ncbi:hypothetical protein [Aureibacillus halotolerans]|uniref:Uncharacterized protein n=1 Tax=Aureibacillus halotolerans TaxID=1508390 RepID=A0A4R6U632_9BACI|nr:hypothetical protein [Aureibacillus halotolerans]TDQ40313.1 hypothetical protein EV213_10629 [Aureibacillus halotolerans]
MGKQTFFVNVQTGEMQTVDVPDNEVTYEVHANEEERAKLERYLDETKEHQFDAKAFFLTPLDESYSREEQKQHDRSFVHLFKFLHELGTTETKTKIESLGIL